METSQHMHSAFESLCPAEWSRYQLHHEKFLLTWRTAHVQRLAVLFLSIGRTGKRKCRPLLSTFGCWWKVGAVFLIGEKYVFAFKATCCPLCINKLISTKTCLSIAKNWPTMNSQQSSVFTSARKISKSFQLKRQQRSKRFHMSSLRANEIQVPSLSTLW